MPYLDTILLNNSIQNWLIAAGITVAAFFVFKIAVGFISRRLEKLAGKTKTQIDDIAVVLLHKTTSLLLFALALYCASLILNLSTTAINSLRIIIILSGLIQAAIWGNTLISQIIDQYVKKKMESDASGVTTVTAIGFVGKLVLYTALFLIALDNLGFNITTLIAGLGIGGIAIALALQNILGDLFASLSIVLDKPFVIGDFIIVDNYLGAVEHIGLKTTRIRSLSGEQLVFSNNDLLKSRIRNYKRMYERRVVFGIGVVYQTTQEKLEKIPVYIKDIIIDQENVRFDRAHFKEYGNFSLNFEIVYWIKSPDYNTYMDIQQAINLAIFKKFKDEQIEFAYPTQMLYVRQSAD